MKIRDVLVLILIIVLGDIFSPAAAQSTPAAAQMLDLPNGDAYLSPDGQHIFLIATSQDAAKKLCIYSATGQPEVCGTFPTAPDLNSIRWSPDSKWVAMTENFFQFFREPDIWVMDAQTGTLTDLTDDKITKFNFSDMKSLPSIDVAPTWTADSSQVLFLRYHGGDQPLAGQQHNERAELFQVAAEGGNAVQIGSLTYPPNTPPFPTYALAFDGTHIAYNVDVAKKDDPANGLWVASPNGKNARQVMQAYGIVNATFSADGRYVMGFNGLIIGQPNFAWDVSSSIVVALAGDDVIPNDLDHPAQWAAWSPFGASLAYIVRNPTQPDQDGLYVAEEPGKAASQAYAGTLIPSAAKAMWRSLYWATNNTILVQTTDRKFILIEIRINSGGQRFTDLFVGCQGA